MDVIKSFPPVADPRCRVLVLGTAPSEASLLAGGNYGHKRNAFWPIMYALWRGEDSGGYPGRHAFLLRHGVALWDVVYSCEREGSLDSAIRNPVPNDIESLLRDCPHIRAVFCNGGAAHALFKRFFPNLNAVRLPSTSPAAAMYSFQEKLAAWQAVKEAAEGGVS